MGILFGLLILLAVVLGIASFVGFVMLDIQAFRESPLWGLLVLFFSPITAIIFALRNWDEARKPFLIYMGSSVGSFVMMFLAMVAGVGAVASKMPAEFEQAQLAAPGVQATPQPAAGSERPSQPFDPPLEVVDAGTIVADDADRAVPQDGAPLTMPDVDDPRVQRTLDRTQQFKTRDNLPTGYTVVAFGNASEFVGRRVRVVAADGTVHKGRLTDAGNGMLELERQLSGGTFSYELNRSDVKAIQVYYR